MLVLNEDRRRVVRRTECCRRSVRKARSAVYSCCAESACARDGFDSSVGAEEEACDVGSGFAPAVGAAGGVCSGAEFEGAVEVSDGLVGPVVICVGLGEGVEWVEVSLADVVAVDGAEGV